MAKDVLSNGITWKKQIVLQSDHFQKVIKLKLWRKYFKSNPKIFISDMLLINIFLKNFNA